MRLTIHPAAFLLGSVLISVAWLALRTAPPPPLPASHARPAPTRIERDVIDVEPATLRRYEGIYWIDGTVTVAVKLEGDRLFADATNTPRQVLLPTGENEFFVKELDANIVFEIDADESARGFVVRFAAGEAHAKRIR